MRDTRILLVFVVLIAVPEGPISAQREVDTLRLYSRHDAAPRRDPNGFLLNPTWLNAPPRPPDINKECRFRVTTGNLEERTLVTTRGHCLSADERSLVTLDEPASALGLGLVCSSNSLIGDVRGHINWFPVTATGQLGWVDFSGGLGEDNDLTFSFSTPEPNAVTSGNSSGIGGRAAYHIEFYYYETLTHLDDTLSPSRSGRLSWWHALNDSLENSAAMRRLVNGRLAVVTGLFGLDGVHDFQAELHPVFAMSVLIDTARTETGKLREQWAVMVRNRGNEGDCSIGALPMVTATDRDQTFVIDLRSWANAGAPRVYLGPSWITDPRHSPRVRADSEHVYIGFTYPRADGDGPDFLFLGTIFLEWSSDGSGPAVSRFRSWLPAGAPALKLQAITRESSAVRIARRAPRFLPGRPGGGVLQATRERNSLRPLQLGRLDNPRQQQLDPIEAIWHPDPDIRAERTDPQLIPKRIIRACPPTDPVCHRAARAIVGASLGPPIDIFGGYYVFAHALPALKHLGGLGDFLSGFGYRLEVRRDRFRRDCDTTCTPRNIDGPSLRISAVLAPNSMRLGTIGTVTTYFIWGGGVSWAHAEPAHYTWGIGVGGQINTPLLSGLFAEFLNYGRTGGFLNHWTFNFGYML